MSPKDIPLLEFDDTKETALAPGRFSLPKDIPERCVLCFFHEVIDDLVQEGRALPVTDQRGEAGSLPVYELDVFGQKLTLLYPGVGAPRAAGLLEEVIALGAKKFIACGDARALDKENALGQLLIPYAAVRDEGTSYHYLPSAREVEASPEGIAAIERILKKHDIPYLLTKTWTTDAIYRQTPAKAARRQAEGCLCVEMEAAALFAVAKFRGVCFAQILYGRDDVSQSAWDHLQGDDHEIRAQLFWLAAEVCLSL